MSNYRFETLQVHAGQEVAERTTGSRAVPIYQTTSYVFDDCAHAQRLFDLKEAGNIYTRINNPTNDIFEQRMAALEGGVGALAYASGMAAVSNAIMNIASTGQNIVCSNNLYGGTHNLFTHTFPQFGIEARFVDPNDFEGYRQNIDENTRCIYTECLGNPNCDVVDIEKLAEIAHENNIPLIVDSTFATPVLIRPLDFGADVVVHSATKFIGGHGTSIGGVLVDGGRFDWAKSGKFPALVDPDPSYHGVSYTTAFGNMAYIVKARVTLLRDLGATISPFNSFLFLQGLETLSLRVERHMENTIKIVEYLANHDKVEVVNHPHLPSNEHHELGKKYFPKGAGSIFTFRIKGGAEEAMKFIDNLKLFSLLANVADAKSLIIHPATTTHSQMSPSELEKSGIYPNTIRLSIGIENVDDLIEDLERGLAL